MHTMNYRDNPATVHLAIQRGTGISCPCGFVKEAPFLSLLLACLPLGACREVAELMPQCPLQPLGCYCTCPAGPGGNSAPGDSVHTYTKGESA